jgi:Na+/proline symporter
MVFFFSEVKQILDPITNSLLKTETLGQLLNFCFFCTLIFGVYLKKKNPNSDINKILIAFFVSLFIMGTFYSSGGETGIENDPGVEIIDEMEMPRFRSYESVLSID